MQMEINQEHRLLPSQRSALQHQIQERICICPQQMHRFRQQGQPLNYGIDGLQACYSLYLTSAEDAAHFGAQKLSTYQVYLHEGAQKIPLILQKFECLMRNAACQSAFPLPLEYSFIVGMIFAFIPNLLDGLNRCFMKVEDPTFGQIVVGVGLSIIVLLLLAKATYFLCWPKHKPLIPPE